MNAQLKLREKLKGLEKEVYYSNHSTFDRGLNMATKPIGNTTHLKQVSLVLTGARHLSS